LLGLQVLRQHAEDARNFVAAAITPTGGANRDNTVGVNAGNPNGKGHHFLRNDGLSHFGEEMRLELNRIRCALLPVERTKTNTGSEGRNRVQSILDSL
jgi:hypothetical protein